MADGRRLSCPMSSNRHCSIWLTRRPATCSGMNRGGVCQTLSRCKYPCTTAQAAEAPRSVKPTHQTVATVQHACLVRLCNVPWRRHRRSPYIALNGITYCPINTGMLIGSRPTWLYRGWRPRRTFAEITDGLSNTLLIGEKHLNPDHLRRRRYGDSTYYNDDQGRVTKFCRLAGLHYPLARVPHRSYIDPDNRYLRDLWQFGMQAGRMSVCDGRRQRAEAACRPSIPRCLDTSPISTMVIRFPPTHTKGHVESVGKNFSRFPVGQTFLSAPESTKT